MFFPFLSVISDSKASEEIELMQKIAAQDQKALKTLYDQYAKLLYSLILHIVKKEEEAEDILQEVFLQIWKNASKFNSQKGNVYAWVVTLARNRAIDRIRSKTFQMQNRRSLQFDEDMDKSENTPLDITIMLERTEIVKKALQQIPEKQKEVINIAYFGGYSQSEIAQKLNIPLGTVKTRMLQGMKKLQKILLENLK